MSNTVVGFVVRGSDGLINRDASIAKFSAAFVEYVTSQAAQRAALSEAIHAVFDAYRGQVISTRFVCDAVRANLKTDHSNFTKVGKAVTELLGLMRKSGELRFQHGPGGGYARVSDVPAEETQAQG